MAIQQISVTDDAVQAKIERTEEEAKTHALFAAHFKINGVTPDEAVLGMVFKAKYADALHMDDIVPLFKAFHSAPDALEDDAQKALGRLVRAKVLRSFRSRGRRYWEVNY